MGADADFWGVVGVVLMFSMKNISCPNCGLSDKLSNRRDLCFPAVKPEGQPAAKYDPKTETYEWICHRCNAAFQITHKEWTDRYEH